MQTKPLLYGLIGFFAGGLLVATAATLTGTQEDASSNDMSMMTHNLQNKRSSEFDAAFLSDMIVHHQAAVDMAKLAETRAEHTEIKDLSARIITTQQEEIDQMRLWQQEWNLPEPDTTHGPMHNGK